MDFVYIKYKEITFPLRDCTFTCGEFKSIKRLIGSELMNEVLITKNGNYADEEAADIDTKIAYFIPHDLLLTFTDQEIFDYIFYHIDSEIYDDFNY